jgi:hypothetical protein
MAGIILSAAFGRGVNLHFVIPLIFFPQVARYPASAHAGDPPAVIWIDVSPHPSRQNRGNPK